MKTKKFLTLLLVAVMLLGTISVIPAQAYSESIMPASDFPAFSWSGTAPNPVVFNGANHALVFSYQFNNTISPEINFNNLQVLVTIPAGVIITQRPVHAAFTTSVSPGPNGANIITITVSNPNALVANSGAPINGQTLGFALPHGTTDHGHQFTVSYDFMYNGNRIASNSGTQTFTARTERFNWSLVAGGAPTANQVINGNNTTRLQNAITFTYTPNNVYANMNTGRAFTEMVIVEDRIRVGNNFMLLYEDFMPTLTGANVNLSASTITPFMSNGAEATEFGQEIAYFDVVIEYNHHDIFSSNTDHVTGPAALATVTIPANSLRVRNTNQNFAFQPALSGDSYLLAGTSVRVLGMFDEGFHLSIMTVYSDAERILTSSFNSGALTSRDFFTVRHVFPDESPLNSSTRNLFNGGATISAMPRIVSGWEVESAVVTPTSAGTFNATTNAFNGTMPNGNVMVTYTYRRTTLNVTYHATSGANPPANVTGIPRGINFSLNAGTGMTHEPGGDGSPVRFVGWTTNEAAARDRIYNADDVAILPAIITQILDIQNNTSVFAVWGYDTTGTGVSDVIDSRWTVTYSATLGNNPPPPDTNILNGSDHMLETDMTYLPTHPNIGGHPVVFLGWTLDEAAARERIYRPADIALLPDIITEIENVRADITVFAVWASTGGGPIEPERVSVTYNSTMGLGGPGTIGNISRGTTWTLSTHLIPFHFPQDSVQVRFVGWTLNETMARNRIYAGEDRAILTEIITQIPDIQSNHTVFAVWGFDTNNSGIADVLEGNGDDTWTVTYDASRGINPPAADTGILEGTNHPLRARNNIGTMSHPNIGGVPILFVGWTTNSALANERVYAWEDRTTVLPALITEITNIQDDITVFAIWGSDTNGTGVPDVLEDRFTVTYHASGGINPPAADTGIVEGTNHPLRGHANIGTMSHPNQGGHPVRFVGWTTNSVFANARVYSNADRAIVEAQLITQITNIRADTPVFAIWGFDTTGTGVPDVIDYRWTVTYNATLGSNPPPPDTNVLNGSNHPLRASNNIGTMSHPNVSGIPVIFLGWTTNQTFANARVYTDSPADRAAVAAQLITQITDIRANQTVFAVWGVDVPLVRQFTVTYNATLGSNPPPPDTNIAEGSNHNLRARNNVGTMSHPPQGEYPVVFVGWTLNETAARERVYTRYDNVLHLLAWQIANIQRNTEVFAIWSVDTTGNGIPDVLDTRWTVNFDISCADSDSDQPADQVVMNNRLAIEPAEIPTKYGYLFDGWGYRNQANELVKFNFNTPITRNLTLYPVWIELSTIMIVEVSPSGNNVTVALRQGQQLSGNEVLIVAVHRDDKLWKVDTNLTQHPSLVNQYTATFTTGIPQEIGVEVIAFIWDGINTMNPLCIPNGVTWDGSNWVRLR